MLQANFYHCGAYGTPITNNNGGPDPEGCTMGQFSDAVHNIFVELARDEMDHVTGIQANLGTQLYLMASFHSMHCCCQVSQCMPCSVAVTACPCIEKAVAAVVQMPSI